MSKYQGGTLARISGNGESYIAFYDEFNGGWVTSTKGRLLNVLKYEVTVIPYELPIPLEPTTLGAVYVDADGEEYVLASPNSSYPWFHPYRCSWDNWKDIKHSK